MSKRIGRFEILGEISHSPVGCVYKAQDAGSGQVLALKAVKLEADGEQGASLLRLTAREAENTKTLNSHNIALLYGAGEIEGKFCGTMEYVQGNSVGTMLERGEAFSLWDLQDIARQACQGLDHAHARHVVHYSLEPDKLMVQWDGTVKLLGFGISQLSLHPTLLAEKSPVLNYMSPEQVRGEPIDARSNLFSLGAILYEMATGRKAFDGVEAEQVKQQILESHPQAPGEINNKIHPALSDVIMKALCKSPDERYASGQELAKAIENHRAGEAPAPPKAPVRNAPAARTAEPPGAFASGLSDQLMNFSDSVQPAQSSSGFGSAAAARMAVARTEDPAEISAPAPMRDEASPSAAKPKSFSEISELPPLKEAHVQEFPEPVPDPLQELREPHYRGPQPAAPKPQPKEMAQKAVAELRKTPPRLFLYSIGGALAIILLVLAVIASRIRSENALDDGNAKRTASRAAATAQQQSNPPVASSVSLPPARASQPRSSEDQDDRAYISIKPKPVPRKVVKPTPPVAVMVPGQLSVSSTPEGAHLVIDGQGDPGWTTPYEITGVTPGTHTVTISKEGFTPETRTIQVAAHSKSFISVSLAQLNATVLVMGDPAGASIIVDGHDSGRVTPSQISVTPGGNHALLVRKQGYLDEATTVNLQPGQSFRFTPTLRQLGVTDDIKTASKLKLFGGKPEGAGTVSVKTQPKGAQIAVNRRILDKLSPVDFYLNPGTYVIDITLTGYKSVQRVVRVEKGGKLTVEETLDHE